MYLSQNSYTALRWAVNKGYIEIIRTLIKFGADINTRDRVSKTQLQEIFVLPFAVSEDSLTWCSYARTCFCTKITDRSIWS
jgi:hypothetical protein